MKIIIYDVVKEVNVLIFMVLKVFNYIGNISEKMKKRIWKVIEEF